VLKLLEVSGLIHPFLRLLPHWCLEFICLRWQFRAHFMQLPEHSAWTIWLIIAGRGAGKTRAGAEWVRGLVTGSPGFAAQPVGRIALVGETLADAREVMVDGPSGILAVHPRAASGRSASPTLRKLAWPNGAVAHVFSAEDPDSLRGPQFEAAWADELAKWRYVDETWDMLQFACASGRIRARSTPQRRGRSHC
jgi:phage terminase large subunit-like protein